MTDRHPEMPLAQLALLPHLTEEELDVLRVALEGYRTLLAGLLAGYLRTGALGDKRLDPSPELQALVNERGQVASSLLTAVLEAQGSLR